MNYLSVTNFLRGLFEHEGIESKMANEGLTKLHNVDLDIVGRMISRTGYEAWEEQASFALTEFLSPDTGNMVQTQFRIQNIYEFIDVSNKKFIVIITNGYIYFESINDITGINEWECINVNQRLNETQTKIGIAYYLDLLFFNDPGQNVYLFNANYKDGQKLSRTHEINRQIHFADNIIYLRNNDYTYTDETIVISGASSGIGKEIYDSLDSYNWRTDLSLGFFMKIEDSYYVLDNGLGVQARNTCSIIKLDKALLYVSHIDIIIEPNVVIMNFDYDITGAIIIQVKDKELIEIIVAGNMSQTIRKIEGDMRSMEAPIAVDGKKYYSVAIDNKLNNIYLYTYKLPDKADWFQPVLMDKIDRAGIEIKNEDQYGGGGIYGVADDWDNDDRIWRVRNPNLPENRQIYPAIVGKSIHNSKNEIGFKWQILSASYWWGPTFHIGYYFAQNYTEMSEYESKNIDPFVFKKTLLVGKSLNSDEGYYPKKMNLDKLHWNWDTDIQGPTLSPHYPGQDKAREKGIIPKYDEYKFSYHKDFHYNKDHISDVAGKKIYIENYGTVEKEELERNTEFLFYLNHEEDTFNPDIFSDKNTSKYVLVVCLDLGNLKMVDERITKIKTLDTDDSTENHRLIIPLVKITDLKRPLPIIFHDECLYFGTYQRETNFYRYYKYNISDRTFELWSQEFKYKEGMVSKGIDRHISITLPLHISKSNEALSHTSSTKILSVDGANKGSIDPSFLSHFGSLNSWSEFKSDPIENDDIPITGFNLRRLGIPKIPKLSIAQTDPLISTFANEQRFIYYVAYQFYSGSTTDLSDPSQRVVIDASLGDDKAKIIIKDLDLLSPLGVTLFPPDDIAYINVYRQEEDIGDNGIYLIGQLEYDSDTGEWKAGSYDPFIYEDILPTLPPGSVLFDNSKVLSYPVSDIFIHKNTLVLVDNYNEQNRNVLQYSEEAMAESIPPSNTRAIQPGDGDFLVTGTSAGDYAYIFKSKKIYAILGQIRDGQLIDVDLKTGCPYKNMITSFENVIYFLNDYGIYKIANNQLMPVTQQRINNYFDKNRSDSIMFKELLNHGFARVDVERREILFHVPQKTIKNNIVKQNNLVIVFNVDYNYFKTKDYYHNISEEQYINGLDNDYVRLLGDYNGNIYKISKAKNDYNHAIKWLIRTKYFNLDTNSIDKIFKILKIAGKFLKTLRVSYWIDGEQFDGSLMRRPSKTGIGSAMIKMWNRGAGRAISIQMSGENLNDYPVEIDEILIGYEILRTFR